LAMLGNYKREEHLAYSTAQKLAQERIVEAQTAFNDTTRIFEDFKIKVEEFTSNNEPLKQTLEEILKQAKSMSARMNDFAKVSAENGVGSKAIDEMQSTKVKVWEFMEASKKLKDLIKQESVKQGWKKRASNIETEWEKTTEAFTQAETAFDKA